MVHDYMVFVRMIDEGGIVVCISIDSIVLTTGLIAEPESEVPNDHMIGAYL
jgi:hypothetical protein